MGDTVPVSEVERRYGVRLRVRRRLTGGDECDVWLAASDVGAVVVRVSPPWRTPEEVAWTQGLVRFVAAGVPEAVAPLRALDGATAFGHEGGWVAVFPFVPGRVVDRRRSAERLAAGRLLARLHLRLAARALAEGDPAVPRGRPQPTEWGPVAGEPAVLADGELDDWYARRVAAADLLRGPVHGDYYRRNLRWGQGRVVGVIDWDDAHVDFTMQEVAWAAWEFAKSPAGDDLDVGHARAFLEAYREAGGPCARAEYRHAVPFIRRRLRGEIRGNLSAAARGEPWDAEYVRAELRAFEALRGVVGSGVGWS